MNKNQNTIIVSGKRKRAIAKARITQGQGIIKINKKPYENLDLFEKLKIKEVVLISKNFLKKIDFNVLISVEGGGKSGQIEAARTALAKAIIKFSKSQELEKAFLDYDRNILVSDVRRKEPNKPGDSKARKKRQSSKRWFLVLFKIKIFK